MEPRSGGRRKQVAPRDVAHGRATGSTCAWRGMMGRSDYLFLAARGVPESATRRSTCAGASAQPPGRPARGTPASSLKAAPPSVSPRPLLKIGHNFPEPRRPKGQTESLRKQVELSKATVGIVNHTPQEAIVRAMAIATCERLATRHARTSKHDAGATIELTPRLYCFTHSRSKGPTRHTIPAEVARWEVTRDVSSLPNANRNLRPGNSGLSM